MKTSARNQFAGKIAHVAAGAVNDEVSLEVPGVGTITAIVTHASTVNLGLKPGVQACALIKASSVIVVAQGQGLRFSARNHLQGTVSRVHKGAVNTEVVIGLPAGGAVVAIITNESADALGLAAGQQAAALFKASSVIIGVPT